MVPRHKLSSSHGMVCFQCCSPVRRSGIIWQIICVILDLTYRRQLKTFSAVRMILLDITSFRLFFYYYLLYCF